MARGKNLNMVTVFITISSTTDCPQNQLFYLFLVLEGCVVISQAEDAGGGAA